MGKRILIVDDHEKNLKLVKVVLKSNGYETIEAEDGKKGIEKAREHLPDMILMDIQMPEIDGLEAMKILKSNESTGNIPIIALTSYVMKGDKERFLAEGFDAYIPKPVDINELLKTVKEIINS